MKKSVKVVISGKFNHSVFDYFMIEQATKLRVAGSMQVFDKTNLIMYAVGDNESVESLIDLLYDDDNGSEIDEVDIKPLDEEKEFRGVFRVIR